MNLPRAAAPRLLELVRHFPVVVVAGARQVGKTTLVRSLFGEEWPMVTLDPTLDVSGARADPDLLLASHPDRLIVDEVQYAPELVAAIKRSVDRDRRPGRFVLTGSQQWSVLRNMAESLAGRAVFFDLHGFTLQEAAGLGARRSWLASWLAAPEAATLGRFVRLPNGPPLNERLFRGTLPEANALPVHLVPDFFGGYRRTYIERDVRLLADVADAQAFGRFLSLAAALTAQEVNSSEFGRELGVSPPTARRWLGLLAASYQWLEVPAWSRNTVKRVSARAKGHMVDSGLACASQLLASPAAVDVYPRRGALFESAVVADLTAQASVLSPRPQLWHWRAHQGAELDLLIEWNGVLHPVEVKLHSHPKPADARGTDAFRAAYPRERVAPGLVVAPAGEVRALTPTTWVVPWDAVPAAQP